MEKTIKWTTRVVGILIAFISIVVYIVTLSRGPHPGESARLLVQSSGIFPQPFSDNHIWGVIVTLIRKIFPGSLSVAVGTFSALCGALSVWLIYHLVSAMIVRIASENRSEVAIYERIAGLLGGTASALCLAFSIPFWMASNRTLPGSFHAMLFLIMALLLMLNLTTGKRRYAFVFVFLYGAFSIDLAALILLVVPAGLLLLYGAWTRQQLNLRFIGSLVLCGLAGLSVLILAAWRMNELADGYVRETTGIWHELLGILVVQYYHTVELVRINGWLLVFFFTGLPFLMVFAVAKRSLTGRTDWANVLMHVIFSIISLIIIVDVKISPWRLLGGVMIPVAPYILASIVVGYLVAYWFLWPWLRWDEDANPVFQRIKGGVALGFSLPFLTLVLAVPFFNLEKADARSASLVLRYIDDVLDCIQNPPADFERPEYLVTDGILDAVLLARAFERGTPLKMLSMGQQGTKINLRYAASFINDPELKRFTDIGMDILVINWLKKDSGLSQKLAVLWPPDILTKAGLVIVPHKTIFFGAHPGATTDTDRMFGTHKDFWRRFLRDIGEGAGKPFNLAALEQMYIRRHLSLVANELGVYLEDAEKKSEAFYAYSMSNIIWPFNVSSLLNQSLMIEAGWKTGSADKVAASLNKLKDSKIGPSDPVTLVTTHGRVRSPYIFNLLGEEAARLGKNKDALAGLKQVADLAKEDKYELKKRVASLQLRAGLEDESEQSYMYILTENPGDVYAMLGLVKVYTAQKQYDKAEEYLAKAEAADKNGTELLDVVKAKWLLAKGDISQSEVILKKCLEQQPDLVDAWLVMVDLLFARRDNKGLNEAVTLMQSRQIPSWLIFYAEGIQALIEGNLTIVYDRFSKVRQLKPTNIMILETLLKIDLARGDLFNTQQHTKELMRYDEGSALGNHALALLQISAGELDKAESSLNISLAREKSASVLNDLAWVLLKRDRLSEAEDTIRQSIEMEGKLYNSWDTFGVILMEKKNYTEAEKAILKALDLSRGEDPGVLLNLADLYYRKGDAIQSKNYLDKIEKKKDLLTKENKQKYSELRRKKR